MDPSDLVLVCILKDKRDLEIARVLGWYRIPLKSAPKTVAVDYLAFYQAAKFGAEKWSINYVALVRGHELTTRAELLRTQPDHPRAQEPYYKIQIGPLERLPRPVPSRAWRRITFLYTTGERLLAATELNDLIVQSEERERLWKALHERGLAAEKQYEQRGAGELDLALLCALGTLGISLGDLPASEMRERPAGVYLTFPEATVNANLPKVVQTIEQAVQRLGGPERGEPRGMDRPDLSISP
ncbi:MAG: hypothetical protein IT318_24380 [Anaerolineales bacterium]|nr:hypothetical protein [Anaerolineales bacterium]